MRWRLIAAGVLVVLVAGLALSGERNGFLGKPVDSFIHVHGLDFPAWSDHPYLATHRGLIALEDPGPWRHTSEEAHDLMGFSAHPTREFLYASGHPAPGSDLPDPLGFLMSRDGGATWELRSLGGDADFHAMAVGPDGLVVYGWNVARDPGLYRSPDAGLSWGRLNDADLWTAGGVLALTVDPHNADRVLAGTEAGIMQSTDGGLSWEPLDAGSPVTGVGFALTSQIIAYVADPAVGLVASAEDDNSWETLGLALPDDAVGHIAPHPTDPETMYVGTLGEAILRTTDGGTTWHVLAEDGARLDPPREYGS